MFDNTCDNYQNNKLLSYIIELSNLKFTRQRILLANKNLEKPPGLHHSKFHGQG